MKTNKKIGIVSAAIGSAAILGVAPVVATSCSLFPEQQHNYTIDGVLDANIPAEGSTSERTLSLIENGKTVTDDVVWSLESAQGEHSYILLNKNKYKVYGTTKGTDTFKFIGVCNGSKATKTMNVDISDVSEYTVEGNDTVITRVNKTTDWIDLRLKNGTDYVDDSEIMWSIYGTGTHAHAQRNSDVSNQYNITGEIQGNDTLKARAIHEYAPNKYKIIEFEIPVQIEHTYHIATDGSEALDDVNVKYSKTTDPKTFKLLDETGAEVTDQQNVSYSIKGQASQEHSTIALQGTNNNQYKVTGDSYGQNDIHTIIATYDNDTFESQVKVNVDHSYTVKGDGVDSPLHVRVGEETDWLTLSLVDEDGKEAIPKTEAIAWSIYNLDGLDGGVTRTDIANLYKVKGIEHGAITEGKSTGENGHFKLSAKATIDKEDIQCKIEVYIEHNYHIKFYDKNTDALNVTLNEDSAEQQFHLIDDEGNEVADPQNVTYSIKDGEAAKGTHSTINLSSGSDKYTVHGDTYGEDSHTIVATYNNKTYETKLNVNVNHQYHVVGSQDISNINIKVGEETGWIYLSLLDENNNPAEAKESLTWSIYNTDGLQNAVGRDSETTNGFNVSGVAGSASTVGTSTQQAGKFAFKAKAVLDKELEVEFTINVNIKHSYRILPIADIYLNPNEVSDSDTFKLYDDEETLIESGVDWTLTPTAGTYSSATTFVSTTGEYAFTASANEGTDTYEVKANYDNIDYTYQFKVIVTNYSIKGVSNSISIYTVGSSETGTARLCPTGSEAGVTGAVWSVSFNATQSKTRPAYSTLTIDQTTGEWKASADGAVIFGGTDSWTIKAEYMSKTYTFSVNIKVSFW